MRKSILIAIVALCSLTSCRYISSVIHDDDVVARVGDVYLYRAELETVVPKGLAREDSLNLAAQYINSWAKDIIYTQMAEENLPKDKKDVAKDLEEYRRSLLKYRYEEMYVNARLDTAITPAQVHNYYVKNPSKFTTSVAYAQVRLVIFPENTKSNTAYKIRRLISSMVPEELSQLANLVDENDFQLETFEEQWISEDELCDAFNLPAGTPLFASMYKNYIERNKNGQKYLAYVTEFSKAGSAKPEDMCLAEIREYILSQRRRELLVNLEKDLMDNARSRGKFKTY